MKHRNALIAAASAVGIVLAGVTAVGANIGILAQADDGSLGQLSAASSQTTPEVVTIDDASGTASTAGSSSARQEFAVDVAGTVALRNVGGTLAIDEVRPAAGWTTSPPRTTATTVEVTFNAASTRLVFVASLNPDGTIGARVDRPTSAAPPASTPPATFGDSGARIDDDHGDDDHEDDRGGDDHDEREDEHEGRDDDD